MLLSVIIPCFNEEKVIETTHGRLLQVLEQIEDMAFEIIYVDDGSSDETHDILMRLHSLHESVRVVRFSRNFGKEMALTAGLAHAAGDAALLMDADLQDPPELIPKMITKWREGYHVVYGVRMERPGDTNVKRWTAKAFYRFINRLAELKMPLDAGDFRLMDRKAIDAFLTMPEQYRYLRGMTSWIGFRQVGVPCRRLPRAAGTTKYSFSKMVNLALDAIFSFSTFPLRLVTLMGLMVSLLALGGIVYAVIMRLFTDIWVTGWTALFITVLFLGGVQLAALGIIGEYIGRTYGETKQRPCFIVQERTGFKDADDSKRSSTKDAVGK
jgi:dolichol-phosphate mannosyltransferase